MFAMLHQTWGVPFFALEKYEQFWINPEVLPAMRACTNIQRPLFFIFLRGLPNMGVAINIRIGESYSHFGKWIPQNSM
jgi:hypothetical protein